MVAANHTGLIAGLTAVACKEALPLAGIARSPFSTNQIWTRTGPQLCSGFAGVCRKCICHPPLRFAVSTFTPCWKPLNRLSKLIIFIQGMPEQDVATSNGFIDNSTDDDDDPDERAQRFLLSKNNQSERRSKGQVSNNHINFS
jgi:hypothetical protein